jgi:ribosomal protein L25 (general stress protein Ctc)
MGIHHHDRKIVGERGVLKAVIEQDDIRASLCGGGARPASLSLATQVFAKAARSSASSPVSDAR